MINYYLKKNLALAITLLSLITSSSCQTNNKNKAEEDFKIEDNISSNQPLQPYETVNNEQDAIAINKQIPEKSQEIEVQDRVFFGYDSFEISTESKKILDTQVAWLKSDEKIKITIEGHCDERGTREYNLALGERRAESAKQYLIAEGINPNRISIISYGKERPAFMGASEETFAKNRRAVVVVD